MQIFFLPDWITIILFIIVWMILQIGLAIVSNKISDEKFNENSWLYKSHKWEKSGKIYDDVFKVRHWKENLPDGAALFKKGLKKKRLISMDEKYLETFIKETCRAEWGHWMQILPFWIFGLWAPSFVIWIMLVYALVLNMPCIIAQRYNRPRLKKLLKSLKEKA